MVLYIGPKCSNILYVPQNGGIVSGFPSTGLFHVWLREVLHKVYTKRADLIGRKFLLWRQLNVCSVTRPFLFL